MDFHNKLKRPSRGCTSSLQISSRWSESCTQWTQPLFTPPLWWARQNSVCQHSQTQRLFAQLVTVILHYSSLPTLMVTNFNPQVTLLNELGLIICIIMCVIMCSVPLLSCCYHSVYVYKSSFKKQRQLPCMYAHAWQKKYDSDSIKEQIWLFLLPLFSNLVKSSRFNSSAKNNNVETVLEGLVHPL